MQINALGPARVAERLMDHVAPDGTVAAMTSELASIANNDDASWDCYRRRKQGSAFNMLMRSMAVRHAGEARSFLLILHPDGVKTDLGGPDATIEIDESIPRVVDQIDRRSLKRHGSVNNCIDYKGDTLPW